MLSIKDTGVNAFDIINNEQQDTTIPSISKQDVEEYKHFQEWWNEIGCTPEMRMSCLCYSRDASSMCTLLDEHCTSVSSKYCRIAKELADYRQLGTIREIQSKLNQDKSL